MPGINPHVMTKVYAVYFLGHDKPIALFPIYDKKGSATYKSTKAFAKARTREFVSLWCSGPTQIKKQWADLSHCTR